MTPEPPLPTRTARPQPTATTTPKGFPCPERLPGESVRLAWERSGALPLDVGMQNASFAFAPPEHFYVGVQNWVGLIALDEPFSTADPFAVHVLGFEQLPDIPPIADIEAPGDNLLYLAGGTQLTIVGAADPCYLVPVAMAQFPFQVRDVELEGDRIYVGGDEGGQLHVAVLDRRALPNIAALGSLTFEFASNTWSVVGEQLLTYDPARAAVSVSDVSNLSAPTTRRIPLALDPQQVLMGAPHLVDDNLSLLVLNKGLGSFTHLLGPQLERSWRPLREYFAVERHVAQGPYFFLIDNFCDVTCTSQVSLATRGGDAEFRKYSLYPHTPVYHYYAISDDVLLAFSEYSLIVLDLTAPAGQEIVRTYPLRG